MALNQGGQGLRRGGQPLYIVPCIAQRDEKIVQRGHHLHTGGRQGILPRPLVVEYGYLLLALELTSEFQIAVDRLGKLLQTLRNGLEPLQPVLILVVSEEHVGTDGSVYLGSHHALGEEAPGHTHLIGLPVGDKGIDIQGREEGDVIFFQEPDHPVA